MNFYQIKNMTAKNRKTSKLLLEHETYLGNPVEFIQNDFTYDEDNLNEQRKIF